MSTPSSQPVSTGHLGSLLVHLQPSKQGTGMAYVLFSRTYGTKKGVGRDFLAALESEELQDPARNISLFSQMYSWSVYLFISGTMRRAKPSEN